MNEAVSYGDYVGLNRENKVPTRTNSRHFRHAIKVAADGPCEHIQGAELDILEMSNL